LDLDYHQSRQTGSLSRDIERGVQGIRFLLRFMLFNILPTLLEIAVVGVVLVVGFGWAFGGLMLAAVTAYVAWSVIVTEWRTRHVRTSHQLDSQAHGRAVDALLNFETVKYFGAEERESRRYDGELAGWEQAMRESRVSLAVLNGGQALIIAVALLGMLWLAGSAVVRGEQTTGDFVMINAYLVALFTPLNFLGFVYREIRASLAALQRLFALLDLEPVVRDLPEAQALSLQRPPRIQVEDLHFGYSPERQILRGVSFSVEAGTTTAIVGPSGSGKSTLARLLFRFYDPQQGRVRINGQDIRGLQLSSLRAEMGVVPQDAVLFNDSIAYNIAYGAPGASAEEVQRAAEQARLQHLLEAAPEGLQTLVGERGMKVSGGEKQRIALARVLLKNPRILILDEATSSLDSESEQGILLALNEAAQSRSCIAIAHRLSTIRDAEQILVLDQGQIVEQGQHAQLLALGGLYARLWQEQSRAAKG
ncbi:MAG: ABCB family ABC transporter ATP-binding protein/permease, partial [Oceanococcaceae bacterium]